MPITRIILDVKLQVFYRLSHRIAKNLRCLAFNIELQEIVTVVGKSNWPRIYTFLNCFGGVSESALLVAKGQILVNHFYELKWALEVIVCFSNRSNKKRELNSC